MSRLSDALRSDRFVITCELNPPKGIDLEPLLAKADALRDVADAVNLTESHAARMAMDPTAVGHLLLDRGVEPIVQMTARDRNRIAIQASLLGAAALGIANFVFMGGDPPSNGDNPQAKPVFDLYAAQLIEAARCLQAGHDLAGNALAGAPRFCVGAVVNSGAADRRTELDNMRRKIDAGAEFLQTQAVFDAAQFESFMEEARGGDAPILAGIIPLKSTRMARYLNARIPGIDVPESLIEEIAAAEDSGGDDVARVGIDIAARTLRAVRPMCRGAHIMAIGWEEKIPELVRAAGLERDR